MEYATIVHSCCCGCGNEVVTPLAPAEWHLEFDGETISLWPSVGNWNLPCRSHYVIRRNRIFECDDWSDEKIARAQQRDGAGRREFYRRKHGQQEPLPAVPVINTVEQSAEVERDVRTAAPSTARPSGFWSWLLDRWQQH